MTMNIEPARIFPLGENALTVEFGNVISEAFNDAAIALADHFNEDPFPGMIEAVPAIASTTVFYRSHQVPASAAGTAFETVSGLVWEALKDLRPAGKTDRGLVEVPVSFSDEDALDMSELTAFSGLARQEVIELFLKTDYRVFMLGFLPGFAYMGVVDDSIAAPRRSVPRLSVPKGSVGIAGRQTGIYPAESPGGWQIIGRTPIEVFMPEADPPCIFSPGDIVRFVPAG